jgi:hypothetical protein
MSIKRYYLFFYKFTNMYIRVPNFQPKPRTMIPTSTTATDVNIWKIFFEKIGWYVTLFIRKKYIFPLKIGKNS